MLIGIQKTGENVEQTVGDANPMPVAIKGTVGLINNQIYSGTATWANNAVANTVVNLDFDLPTTSGVPNRALVTIYNPSTVTGLVVRCQNKITIGGNARYPESAAFTVGANSSRSVRVDSFPCIEGGRLSIGNDTALGASDGFTATIEVRQV